MESGHLDKCMTDCRAAAMRGAIRLAQLVGSGGEFLYHYDMIGRSLPGYNALRHAGSIWAMLHVGGQAKRPAARRAVAWRVKRYRRNRTDGSQLALEHRNQVKAGGNALAILAHLELGTPKDMRLARGLANHLLSLQREDGDYHHKLWVDGTIDEFRSNYYTGEAMFALARFAAAAKAPRYLASALRAERVLGPRGYGVAEQSHWMLYALEAIHKSLHLAPDQGVSHGDLEEHACKIVEGIIDDPAYRARNQSTPTACRSEGLLAGWRLLRGAQEAERFAKLRDRILIEVKKNLVQQLRYQAADGGFINGANDFSVRIDYIQHNISSLYDFAMIQS
jgi:hypothetical protein